MNKALEEDGILGKMLSEIAEAADELEEGLGDNVPEDAALEQQLVSILSIALVPWFTAFVTSALVKGLRPVSQ